MEENKKWTLYIHTNKVNNKKYVGITSRKTNERWGINGNNYIKDNTYFGNAIKKYGWDSFEHEIVYNACLTEQEAKELEQYYIKSLNTKRPNGYNLTDGGDGINGHEFSEESRIKMSKAQRIRADEGRNLTMLGKHHTEETKEKIRAAKLNLTQEQRKNLSDSAKKLWSNDDYKKRKLKELKEAREKIQYKYRPMSEKQKEILSKARTEKCSGINNAMATKVWCIELKQMFNTIKEAGLYFNAKPSTYYGIGECCVGRRNTCMGYHWMYYKDFLNSTEDDINKILSKAGNTKLSNNGMAKKVLCIELDKEWTSAEEAAMYFNVKGEDIRRCCRRNSVLKLNGYHFIYSENK